MSMPLPTERYSAILTIRQGGFKHAFVSQFENEADRDYYLKEDPAHVEFVASLDGVIEGVQVVDYKPGVY